MDRYHLPLLPVRDGEHSLMLGQFADAEVQLQKLLGIEAVSLDRGQQLDAQRMDLVLQEAAHGCPAAQEPRGAGEPGGGMSLP